MMPGWVIQRAGALPGDDGQLLILDRKDGLNGRTVCVVPGNLFWDKTGCDLVRLLDEDDLANATLLATAKPMRDALQALVACQAQVGPDRIEAGAMRETKGETRRGEGGQGCRRPSGRGKGWVLAMLPAKRRLRVAAVPRPGCAAPRPCPGRPAAAPRGGLQ